MFENPRRGRQARNFTTNVPKILDFKSSSEQIFSENCRWVPLDIEWPDQLSTKRKAVYTLVLFHTYFLCENRIGSQLTYFLKQFI